MLDGKRLLITGVLTKGSIAYSVAERAQEQGAQVVLTGFGRTRRMTERAAARLPDPPDVLELDVNNPEDFEMLVGGVQRDPRKALRDKISEPLSGRDRSAFQSLRSRLLAALDVHPRADAPTRTASAN